MKPSAPERDSTCRNRLLRPTAKWLLFVSAALLWSGCSEPVWYLAPDFGEKVAEKEKKPILYYFRSFDSTLHRNMYWNVLKSGPVKRELKSTVNIELEFGFFDEQQRRLNVKKPQTCVFAAPDGTQIGEHFSVNPVPSPPEFAKWLQEMKAKAGPTSAPSQ